MAEYCTDLPDECWELIFKRLHQLHHSHLESPSLSCKRFLSITNTIRTSLSIVDPTLILLSSLFNRFPNLKSIHLNLVDQDLNRVVTDIATSNLNIETLDFVSEFLPLESFKILGSRMKNLRVLNCSRLSTMCDADLIVIADSMPCLEDLDISYPDNFSFILRLDPDDVPGEVGVTDRGIEILSSKLKGLRKINISGITENGIAYFLESGFKIRKLEINHCGGIKNIGNGFELSELEVLGAARSGINDDGLMVIGSRCCGLLDLNLDGCLGVTTVGLKEILTNCKRLRKINLTGCLNMSLDMVDWMLFSRPSLRTIILLYSSLPFESQRKIFLHRGCLVV